MRYLVVAAAVAAVLVPALAGYSGDTPGDSASDKGQAISSSGEGRQAGSGGSGGQRAGADGEAEAQGSSDGQAAERPATSGDTAAASGDATPAEVAEARLPEGDKGIATKYPGDVGVENDPAVLFVERFDGGSLEAIAKRWDEVKDREIMTLVSDVPAASGDKYSLLMTHVGGKGTGGHLYRRLLPGHQQVFARFYVKFDPDCAAIHHFGTHLGGYNPPTRWPQGGAGERPRGHERFTTGVEPYGKDWAWDFYSYWQGMHVHGDGRYWGTPFLSGGERPAVAKGEWICVEMMVKLNDPVGGSDGEQAFWINDRLFRREGQVVSHAGRGFPKGRWTGGWWQPDPEASGAFEGFRWRTDEALKINYLWAYLYITKAEPGHVSKVWFDNIVVATSYVGPIQLAAEPEGGEQGDGRTPEKGG